MSAESDLAALVAELPPFITVAEAARTLRVARATIRRWAAEGRLSSMKVGEEMQSRRLITRASVLELLERSNSKEVAR